MKTILIIEDDAAIAQGLEETLKAEHFEVVCALTGEKGMRLAKREALDLILLDLKLPDMNGEEICRDIRKSGVNTPIMVLTSKKQEMDQVLLLEIGADDYVTKPFSPRVLVARIHAMLRRKTEIIKEIDDFAFGNVQIDFKKQEAFKGKRPIGLSTKEYKVLRYLIQHSPEVVTRDMLLCEVWGYNPDNAPSTRTVDNLILQLRKKIEDNPSAPKHLLTVPAAGYKFVGEKKSRDR
jgi:two-component system alkaline phosphatase synthesis response regulator PhoP